MIKLFASDLDGTLLNVDHRLDEIIVDAIKKINENNKTFCIATGRSMYQEHSDDFRCIDGYNYCISLNGAIITNKENEIIYYKSIDHEFVMKMLKEFPTVSFECLGVDRMYYRHTKEEELAFYNEMVKWSKFHQAFTFERYHMNTVFNFKIEDIENTEILKINCRIKDEKLKEKFKKFIDEHSHLVVDAPFIENFFELTDVSVNKGSAIQQLARMLNIEDDEVAVYGDGLNDLVMLQTFKHSYAPSNAKDKVKECANEVIGSYVDYAVTKHILKTLEKDRQ